jgi:lipid A 3-O-deacylase
MPAPDFPHRVLSLPLRLRTGADILSGGQGMARVTASSTKGGGKVRLAIAAGVVVPALIVSLAARAESGIVSEVLGGVLAHDVGFIGNHAENGADINLETRFVSPDLFGVIGSPRPHLGVSVNTEGNTSQLYTGVTWTFTLLRALLSDADSLFVDASLGGAVHDGHLHTTIHLNHKQLGTRFEFRESFEIGYAIIPGQSISLMLDHISNAGLAHHNGGMENFGLRYGFGF